LTKQENLRNVLFLTQVLPFPLDAGPKIRAYYVIRYLSNKYNITLMSFIRETERTDAIGQLKLYCSRIETVLMKRTLWKELLAILRSLHSGDPFLIERDESAQIKKSLKILMENNRFDFIHADQLWMAPYAMYAYQQAELQGYSPVTILDQHNAVHLIPKRMASESRNFLLRIGLKREAKLMLKYELETIQNFRKTTWVSNEDFQAVTQYKEQSKIDEQSTIIPICIDTELVHEENQGSKAIPRILFIGGMHWPPNYDAVLWFVREVFPIVKAKIPEIEFIAIGKNPPKSLKNASGVFAPGYVENLGNYYKTSQIFVVPIRAGGGMRVKILEAWAQGIPIVSTSIGAEGIAYQHGENIMIADDAEIFASFIYELVNNKELSDQVIKAGRRTVFQHYDWQTIYKDWDKVYESD
jgi:glycosyltransferase involved in cell wall biosynthesis